MAPRDRSRLQTDPETSSGRHGDNAGWRGRWGLARQCPWLWLGKAERGMWGMWGISLPRQCSLCALFGCRRDTHAIHPH